MRALFGPNDPTATPAPLSIHIIHVENGQVLIPSREVLLTGMYARNGLDLALTSPEGEKYIIKNLFLLDAPPQLTDGTGTHVPGELAAQFAGPAGAGEYAAAAPAATPASAIGQVRSVV